MYDELLLVPGPTGLSSRVLKALARPQISHFSSEFVNSFSETLELTKYLFQTHDAQPYILAGSGTLGMESIVTSFLESGDRVLVLDTGPFGERFAIIASVCGAKVDVIKAEFGRVPSLEEVEKKLSEENYKAIFLTHVDTGSTVMNNVKGIVEIAKKYGVSSIVDSVCGVGGMELLFDNWGIDIALAGSQKAIAAPPGLSLIVASKKALEMMNSRKTPIRSFYMDLTRWTKYMLDPSIYVATPAVNLSLALREALLEIKEEGLEKRWTRHRIIAEGIRAGIEKLELKFVAEEEHRADTVTGFYITNKKAGELHSMLKREYRIEVAKGLKELRDSMLRIGHFGNISGNDVVATIAALETSCNFLGLTSKRGAVDVSLSHLEKLISRP